MRDTLRLRATIGVEQNSPILTPGVAKRASWLATARSQLATSWQPAAVAMPFTAAITGFGERTIVSIISEQALHDLGEERAAAVGVVAMRRQLLEVVARGERRAGAGDDDGAGQHPIRRSPRSPRVSAAISSSDRQLRASGRLSVSTATGPWSSRKRYRRVQRMWAVVHFATLVGFPSTLHDLYRSHALLRQGLGQKVQVTADPKPG